MSTPTQRLAKYKASLIGTAEFAEILGMSRQALHNRMARGRLPKPAQRLAMGPVWFVSDIREFVKAYELIVTK
jgi:predicted DNA-binding transcriptional regulator AlpA